MYRNMARSSFTRKGIGRPAPLGGAGWGEGIKGGETLDPPGGRTAKRKPAQRLDPDEALALLLRGTRALHLEVTRGQQDQFLTYLDLLLQWNRRMNLSALRSPAEIIVRHFLESLLLLPHLPETGRLLDIGSGAGFPGLPLKIARPDLTIDLAEATAKKSSFLKEAVRRLGLSGITVLPIFLGQASPALTPDPPWNMFVSRGVNLKVVLKAVEPYWGPGQPLFLLKGPDWRREFEPLRIRLKKRQVELAGAATLQNPMSPQKGNLVILRKTL